MILEIINIIRVYILHPLVEIHRLVIIVIIMLEILWMRIKI